MTSFFFLYGRGTIYLMKIVMSCWGSVWDKENISFLIPFVFLLSSLRFVDLHILGLFVFVCVCEYICTVVMGLCFGCIHKNMVG
jgi:hypothetical protein